jgi:hypothetical protein
MRANLPSASLACTIIVVRGILRRQSPTLPGRSGRGPTGAQNRPKSGSDHCPRSHGRLAALTYSREIKDAWLDYKHPTISPGPAVRPPRPFRAGLDAAVAAPRRRRTRPDLNFAANDISESRLTCLTTPSDHAAGCLPTGGAAKAGDHGCDGRRPQQRLQDWDILTRCGCASSRPPSRRCRGNPTPRIILPPNVRPWLRATGGPGHHARDTLPGRPAAVVLRRPCGKVRLWRGRSDGSP